MLTEELAAQRFVSKNEQNAELFLQDKFFSESLILTRGFLPCPRQSETRLSTLPLAEKELLQDSHLHTGAEQDFLAQRSSDSLGTKPSFAWV